MRLPPRTGLLLSMAAFALSCGSCGGDSPERMEAGAWVDQVCEAAAHWDRELRAANELQVIEDGSPREIKEGVEQFVDRATGLVDAFVASVHEAGEPDVAGGDRVIEAIEAHAADQKGALTGFRDDVKGLEEGDPVRFRDGIFELLENVEAFDLRARLEAIDERDVDGLIGMIDRDPACAATMFNS